MKNLIRQTNTLRRAKFPAQARLLKPVEFKKVFKNSFASADRWFKVLARRNESNCSRLGMAVSRQVDRHAVGRNRIKRIIRESFRQSFEAVVPDPVVSEAQDKPKQEGMAGAAIEDKFSGIDFVVLPRREAATTSNRELFKSLHAHWSRLEHKASIKRETR